MKSVVAVLYAPGINCHEETAFAVELAGLEGRVVNFRDILDGNDALTRYQAVIVPGGFCWGDHLGAGRIFGVHLIARAADQLQQLVEAGKPVLGICNGFQVLVETGLLPDRTVGQRKAALLQNRSAVFESRWVDVLVTDEQSIWTKGLGGRILRMPVAHGEGRLYWEEDHSIHPAVCYSRDGKPTEEYPSNPNGTPCGVAGIRDSTGLIFGLMPHPERAVLEWHGSTDGLELFKNLADYLMRDG
jgi:phosphoribosylformylglycinamidine synthase